MASRKSCTHMTWSEAKSKSGMGGVDKKKIIQTKNVSHDKILAAKIISKNKQPEKDMISGRQAARRARRDGERAAYLEKERQFEKERRRVQDVVQPYKQARKRMSQLATNIKNSTPANNKMEETTTTTKQHHDLSLLQTMAESKQMQVEELFALEAIHGANDEVINAENDNTNNNNEPFTTFLISDSCRFEELRNLFEEGGGIEGGGEEDNEENIRKVANHPLLSFTMQLSVENPNDDNLVASLLLKVTLPVLYPLSPEIDQVPEFSVEYFVLTDKNTVCNSNKPIDESSLGYLRSKELLQNAMSNEAIQILPDPCVYEITSTWIEENLFEKFVIMR